MPFLLTQIILPVGAWGQKMPVAEGGVSNCCPYGVGNIVPGANTPGYQYPAPTELKSDEFIPVASCSLLSDFVILYSVISDFLTAPIFLPFGVGGQKMPVAEAGFSNY